MKRSRKYSTMIYILLYSSILSINLLHQYVNCSSILNPPAIIEPPSSSNATEIQNTTEELLQIIKSSTVKISTEASDLDEVTKHELSSSTFSNSGEDANRKKANLTDIISPPVKVESNAGQSMQKQSVV